MYESSYDDIIASHGTLISGPMGEGEATEEPISAVAANNDTSNVIQDKDAKVTNKTNDIVPICLGPIENECVQPYFPTPKSVPCPRVSSPGTSSTGAYILPKNFVYRFDVKFATAILYNVTGPNSSVLELGAGLGCYTYYFNSSGYLSSIVGYDGAANVYDASGGFIQRADLTVPRNFGRPQQRPGQEVQERERYYDWVICLEVAEHIPREYESIFVTNLISTNPGGIVLSWASPTQPGSGHVNGRTNAYVIDLMYTKGYGYDNETTTFLRSQAELGWFQRTAMVFRLKNTKK